MTEQKQILLCLSKPKRKFFICYLAYPYVASENQAIEVAFLIADFIS